MKTIALFGGSFDPPHVAHVLAATYLLSAGSVDAVWILPTWKHPFGKVSAPFEQREQMCRLAFGPFAAAGLDCGQSAIEADVQGATIDIVRALQVRHPEVHFRIVMGTDLLADRHKWKEWPQLEGLAPPLVLRRPGFELDAAFEDLALPLELPDISSTRLREILRQGGCTAGLLPAAVASYIAEKGLYAAEQ